MREKPLLLGEHETLLGILSEPDEVDDNRPVFLLLNAGIVHRIGPHRKTVQLARALAAAGFRALRFDLSGIGDSPPRRDALGFEASALADIHDVCDHLQQLLGATRFVSMGLCSGADNTFQATLRDERIVGAVVMDGYAYKTPRFYLQHYGKRLDNPKSWLGFAQRVLDKGRERLGRATDGPAHDAPSAAAAVPEYMREFPDRGEVTAQLQQLVDRGVAMYWLYTGGVRAYYNYEQQFFDCFNTVNFKGRVSHDYFASSNHTFTALSTQRQLVQSVVRWAEDTFERAP